MKSLDEIYKGGFFKNRYKLHWRAPIFCQAVSKILNPNSVIDVGCATGDLVKQFREMGITADGIEGAITSRPYAVVHDIFYLDLRCDLASWAEQKWYDVVMCLEVAEHIEPEYTLTFLNNLSYLSNNILISIAGPGEGGHYHVNLQPISYWDKLFSAMNYYQNHQITNKIKHEIEPWKNKPGIKAFWQHLLYYERRIS